MLEARRNAEKTQRQGEVAQIDRDLEIFNREKMDPLWSRNGELLAEFNRGGSVAALNASEAAELNALLSDPGKSARMARHKAEKFVEIQALVNGTPAANVSGIKALDNEIDQV